MFVNASAFPGPALWQGLMLCSLLWYFPAAFSQDMKYFKAATAAYVLEGILLFAWIVS